MTSFILCTYSQEEIRIYGKIYDTDGVPVPNVRYWIKDNPQTKKVSDREGNFSVAFNFAQDDSIVFNSVSFQKKMTGFTKRELKRALKKGEFYLEVTLENRMLPDLVITPEKPDTLFGTQQYYVSDFAYNENGNMVLLTYEQTLRKGSAVRLLNKQMEVIDNFSVPGQAVELQNDWRGYVHLITEDNVYWLKEIDGSFKIFFEDRKAYFRNIAPIIDTISNKVYYSSYSDTYPAFDYYEYDVIDSINEILLTVEDSETMEYYRAEFKYLSNREKVVMADLEIETGIDKEIWAGALYYTKSIYYDPIYAPLFKINEDSLLIFDHYKNQMFTYSKTNGLRDSVRISYHLESRKSGWEEPLIQDPVTRKIYAVFERSGYTYLYEINRFTGQIDNSFKLYFRYLDNLQIRNGMAVYIYRPFESVQRKYLYSEELKLK